MSQYAAVHEVEYLNDKGKSVVAKPGTLFSFSESVSDTDISSLQKLGAIRAPTEEELAMAAVRAASVKSKPAALTEPAASVKTEAETSKTSKATKAGKTDAANGADTASDLV